MKRTLELQQIVTYLGIDPFRYLAWQEKEVAQKLLAESVDEQKESTIFFGLVV
ncbi:hypothetical protein [Paenibacillus sp. N3.4]|uniref:hypothetical protein n=1 Tax=Paenibacillus sp. N3.4 TaxID=2603222 RepID=UPI00164FB3FD|nr:hypothetical protein [Paenibacillus sp. N3.4]